MLNRLRFFLFGLAYKHLLTNDDKEVFHCGITVAYEDEDPNDTESGLFYNEENPDGIHASGFLNKASFFRIWELVIGNNQ